MGAKLFEKHGVRWHERTSVAWTVILETTQMLINRGLAKTNKQTNKKLWYITHTGKYCEASTENRGTKTDIERCPWHSYGANCAAGNHLFLHQKYTRSYYKCLYGEVLGLPCSHLQLCLLGSDAGCWKKGRFKELAQSSVFIPL